MDEKLLSETIGKLNNKKENVYALDASTDLFDHAQEALDRAAIRHEKVLKKNKKSKIPFFLRLYDNSEPFLDFNKGFYPNNVKIGKIIANDKYLTERFLKYSGVKTPDTKILKEHEFNKAENIIRNGQSNFVVKPKDLSHALGAFRNVSTANFEECWNKSIEIQRKYKVQEPIVIIQKQVEGIELRVTVTEGIVDTVSMRAPGFIVGDGKSSIKMLIENKNEERKKNIYHKKNPLKINDDLIKDLNLSNRSLDTVLNKGEYLILYPRTNISTGRENYEVTKYVHPNIMQQAMEAVIAIPGVHTAGVDIIVESLDAKEGTVIEVNQNPAFQLNYFPMYGDKQDPLKKVFTNLLTETQIINRTIDIDSIDQEKFDLILGKYEFLYRKTKALENELGILLEENDQLKEKEDQIKNILI